MEIYKCIYSQKIANPTYDHILQINILIGSRMDQLLKERVAPIFNVVVFFSILNYFAQFFYFCCVVKFLEPYQMSLIPNKFKSILS